MLELGFDQDLNGDGAVGPPSSVAVTTIDTVDGTTLLQIGAAPDAEYVIEGSDAFEPVLSNQGVTFTGGAYTPIAAAELASGGYEVAFKDATTGQYTVWDTDANGDYVSDPIGAVSGSSETAEVLGTIFALPAVQHLSVAPIATDGAITLAEIGDEYVIEDGSGFGQWLALQGSPVTAGQFAGVGADRRRAAGVGRLRGRVEEHGDWPLYGVGHQRQRRLCQQPQRRRGLGRQLRARSSGAELSAGPEQRRHDRSDEYCDRHPRRDHP